ncbi:effector-associated domain EAD1-containing protein, partial [Erythrobacter sp.]|uniref:effector-associated domain EAD1-containing protein n=1 Tax=Erythrobacter sp. TaxID=1042 RepID=UPI00311E9B6C
ALTWGSRTPAGDHETYLALARETARNYEAGVATKAQGEGPPQRPIGPLCDALRRAYPDVRRAVVVLQRAGIAVDEIRTDQSVSKLWNEALAWARDHHRLDAIVNVAIADSSVRAHHTAIVAAAKPEAT